MSMAEVRDLLEKTLREMNEWKTAETVRYKECAGGVTKYISQGKICGLSVSIAAVEKLSNAVGKRNSISRTMTTKHREEIRVRDNHRCAFCGVADDEIPHSDSPLENTLHVHHIDHDRHNNENTNLITLCPICHRTGHSDKIPFAKRCQTYISESNQR